MNKKLLILGLLIILPFAWLSTNWSISNSFPFGNHDVWFHYARAMHDKSILDNLTIVDSNYYHFYPPATSFIQSSFIYLLPLPPFLSFNISVLAIISVLIFVLFYFYRSFWLLFVFFLSSSFLMVYYSTVARLLFLILLVFFLNSKSTQKALILLATAFVHKYGFIFLGTLYVFDFVSFSTFILSFKSKLVSAILNLPLRLFASAIIMISVAYELLYLHGGYSVLLPLVWFGIAYLDKLNRLELFGLLFSSLAFLFYDNTLNFLMTFFLALALARKLETVENRNAKIVFVALSVVLFFASFTISYYRFMATDLELMKHIVNSNIYSPEFPYSWI